MFRTSGRRTSFEIYVGRDGSGSGRQKEGPEGPEVSEKIRVGGKFRKGKAVENSRSRCYIIM